MNKKGINMEIKKLNGYIESDRAGEVSKIERVLKKKPLTLPEMLQELKKAAQKDKKLLEISRDITKIMDLYDEDNKININRDVYLKKFVKEIEAYIPKGNELDYTMVFDLIMNETVEYDENNWNKIYENIKKSAETENAEIDKNALYSMNYEDLVPKHLIDTLKKESDELITGGKFSFESCTQEMLGIINEFVLLKGKITTNMYLNQGVKDQIKIKELLKEVNAASLLEPFTFHDGKPRFEAAKSGQFDGFILHRNTAKVLLATKNENTTIEGDSVFRHFVTGMLIKKKIDQAVLNKQMVNKKMGEWIEHYTNQNYLEKGVEKIKEKRRTLKQRTGVELTDNDYYIPKAFILAMDQSIKDAENRGLKNITIPLKTKEYRVDYKTTKDVFNKDLNKSKNLRLSIEDAIEKRKVLSSVVMKQEELKEVLADEGFSKVVDSPKFLEQIEVDVKKAEMVKNSEFLSIKEMISYYNRNTNEALEDLGILRSKKKDFNFKDKTSFLESLENKYFGEEYNLQELNGDDLSKLLDMAKNELNVELIYYGSVSGKKQANEFHYNSSEEIKNKEFRYGLNILAYANILSDSAKDKFTISSDAALDFVDFIELRAVTKKTKDGYDVDLEKMNKSNFIKDVIHYTSKDIYETNKIKDDSVDFYENLFNATNVLLADFLEDIEAEKEVDFNLDYKDVYSRSMAYKTGRQNETYDLVKTIETLKEISLTKSHKFVHGNSIIETVNNKINQIVKESDDPKLKEVVEKYKPKKDENVRSNRRNRLRP